MSLLLLTLALVPPASTSKILGVFPFPAYSHQKVFQSIWQELSLRGHEVTVLTPSPINNPALTNLTEIDTSFEFDMKAIFPESLLSHGIARIQKVYNLIQVVDYVGEMAVNHPRFKNFTSNSTNRFDLIILESYYPVLYDLSRIFGAPIVCTSSFGILSWIGNIVGNPSHPVLHRDYLVSNVDRDLSVLKNVELFLYYMFTQLWSHFVFRPHGQKLAEAALGRAERDFVLLERNVKMFFVNVNPVLYDARANVPGVLELGLLGMQPKELLSEDLREFLDGATEGVVYLSMGTAIQIEGYSLGETILQGLVDLPYKIILKWKCEMLPYKNEKILCKEWLPQKKILEHPNLRVFVTQGGLHSIEEAILAQVPLVGIPFIADQPMNMYKVSKHGVGEVLPPATLTPDQLKNAIMEVAENQKYRKRIMEVRKMLLDKSMSSLDKFVWWTEYVIRHKDGSHLTSLNLESSWFSYLLGDVIAIFSAALISVFLSFYFVIHMLLTYLKQNWLFCVKSH